MADYLNKLLSLSTPSLCGSRPSIPKGLDRIHKNLAADLVEMLRIKNGFYAFESALHVLPTHCSSHAMDIERWNSAELWKGAYSEEVAKYLFFAEDIFGEQFGLCDGFVVRFDPETAGTEVFADSLDDWAERILREYEVETGYPIAAEYQEKNGPLAPGQRLVPTIPFILGGGYNVDNLYALDAVKAMRFRADIWKQIKDLPKGTKVDLKITGLHDRNSGH